MTTRSLAVPSGTVGGLTARTSKPSRWSEAASATAASLSPTGTGRMAASGAHSLSDVAKRATLSLMRRRASSAWAAFSTAFKRQPAMAGERPVVKTKERALERSSCRSAALPTTRPPLAPSAFPPVTTRAARRSSLAPLARQAPAPCAPMTPAACASSTMIQASCSFASSAYRVSGGVSPSIESTPSTRMTLRRAPALCFRQRSRSSGSL